jgi:hypothetical protein
MAWVTAPSDPLQWRRAGFVELTTAVRPPTSEDGTEHIVVVIAPPTGAVMTLRAAAPLSLAVPVGTRAARIEYAGPAHAPDDPVDASWRVLDVRAFEWTADGVDCTVLRPDDGDRLVGLRWRCGDADDRRAGAALATYTREGRFAGPRGGDGRDRAARRLELVNSCRGCHQLDRVEDRHPTALVQRGTDASGMFSLRSVFRDEDPVERYRPVDTNAGDPAMTPVCPGSDIDPAAARCRDGLRPHLRLDVRAARHRGDPHATAVCAARRSVAAHVDAAARAAVAAALAPCGDE